MTVTVDDTTSISVRCVPTSADGPLTGASLLRLFEQARRELSLRTTLREGCGAGYDGLTLQRAAINAVEPGCVVTVTAMASQLAPTRHRVDYVAVAGAADPHPGARSVVLGQAHGWSVGTTRDGGTQPNARGVAI